VVIVGDRHPAEAVAVMSSLYTVAVDAVDGSVFRGKVYLIHPDALYVPARPTFPAILLAEVWDLLTNGFLQNDPETWRHGDRYPFSEERGKEIAAGMARGAELGEHYACVMGNRPCSGEELRRQATGIVTSYDIGPIQAIPTWGEVVAFESEEKDEQAEQDGERKGSPQAAQASQATPPQPADDPADLEDPRVWDLLATREIPEWPHAEIKVTVGDPAYLAHLTDGMRWSTAQYE
jgi:hypothetical protein